MGGGGRGALPVLTRFLSDVETGHDGSSTLDSGNFPAALALLGPYRPGGDMLGASTLLERC